MMSVHEARYAHMDRSLSVVEERWDDLGRAFGGMTQDLAALSDTSAGIARQLDASASSANGVLVRTAEASAAAVDLARVLASLTDAARSGLAMINGSVSSIGEQLERQMEMRKEEAAGAGAWVVKAVGAAVFGGRWCRGCMGVS
ncbi:hypothetical protein HYPSUDRAFT_723599 [Hypholoma sublateritium FD-334 SS-4]|uniref:Uncharacterized protein n=1 Tax=Hypholoma sublateritium (strain FD-334 SS-4) TaxID=945553 RepID=A0A0D2NRU6_HYPSF|nr:hypothetical protein HYPSUDRAFT_723599 [Hypholoma sublateritium FD-334 SS-4]